MQSELSTKEFKSVLMKERDRILSNSKRARAEELNISTDDLPDEADMAANEINQNLVFRLRDRERQLLGKIEAALNRIDSGTFGTCLDCEEPIESRRLQARPVTTLCLTCKEISEHRDKIYA